MGRKVSELTELERVYIRHNAASSNWPDMAHDINRYRPASDKIKPDALRERAIQAGLVERYKSKPERKKVQSCFFDTEEYKREFFIGIR